MKKEPSTLINKLKKSIFHVFPKLKRNSNNYIFKRSQTQKKKNTKPAKIPREIVEIPKKITHPRGKFHKRSHDSSNSHGVQSGINAGRCSLKAIYFILAWIAISRMRIFT